MLAIGAACALPVSNGDRFLVILSCVAGSQVALKAREAVSKPYWACKTFGSHPPITLTI